MEQNCSNCSHNRTLIKPSEETPEQIECDLFGEMPAAAVCSEHMFSLVFEESLHQQEN